jgi:thiamine pyrophosphate-dependent acetolactate synthase large subunit-like protein
MRRYDCLAALADLVDDELIVNHAGRTAWEWHALRPREGNLHNVSMGMVIPVGLGLALALPHRRVLVLDGDGSVLMNLGALATVGSTAPSNLAVVVFDNESYASTGGLPTATAETTDLAAVARGCGIGTAQTIRTLPEFEQTARAALAEPGPWFVVAKVTNEIQRTGPKLLDGRENTYRFVRYVEQTENRVILKPSAMWRND